MALAQAGVALFCLVVLAAPLAGEAQTRPAIIGWLAADPTPGDACDQGGGQRYADDSHRLLDGE